MHITCIFVVICIFFCNFGFSSYRYEKGINAARTFTNVLLEEWEVPDIRCSEEILVVYVERDNNPLVSRITINCEHDSLYFETNEDEGYNGVSRHF